MVFFGGEEEGLGFGAYRNCIGFGFEERVERKFCVSLLHIAIV